MKKKFTLMLATLVMCTMSLVGCGGEKPTAAVDTDTQAEKPAGDTEDKYNIGFIPMTLNNEYFITMVNGAQKKADELGIELTVQAGQQHANAAEQLQIIENMITSGVDAICIVPSSSEGLVAGLKKCEEAGIPVINIDTKLDTKILEQSGLKPVPFYGTDNYAGAKLAGEYVVANLENGMEVAILTGIEGQQNAADRRNGFADGAADNIKVVAEQTGKWEVDQGYIAAQNIISANPNIKFIFASNDGMGIGALRAVEEADKQDQIKIIGFDAISEALNLVEQGKLLGTVAQYPAEMGIMGVQAAVDMLDGKDVEMNKDTGSKLITKENVAEFKTYLEQYK